MQLDCHVIIQSIIVEFVIGNDRKRFQIHLALAGSFPKGELKPPINHEIDEIVFGRCCYFVYNGHYSVPLQPLTPRGMMWVKQATRQYAKDLRDDGVLETLPRISFHHGKFSLLCAGLINYVYECLSELRCYRIGYRTEWVSLRAYSLYQLNRPLSRFILFEARTGDIVSLLRYVFEKSEYIENIHEILQDYAAWNIEILMRNADFRELLDRVPSLEKAIFRSMWE